MSFFAVIAAIAEKRIVNIGHTWIGEASGAISYLYLNSEGICTCWRPIDLPLSMFASICDSTDHFEEKEKPNFPEMFVLDGDVLYDFATIPEMECPVCFSGVNYRSAIRAGKFAYCPACNARVFRATRLDGIRDVPLVIHTRESRPTVVKESKPKPKKPDDMTFEELVEAGLLKPMSRKILVAS